MVSESNKIIINPIIKDDLIEEDMNLKFNSQRLSTQNNNGELKVKKEQTSLRSNSEVEVIEKENYSNNLTTYYSNKENESYCLNESNLNSVEAYSNNITESFINDNNKDNNNLENNVDFDSKTDIVQSSIFSLEKIYSKYYTLFDSKDKNEFEKVLNTLKEIANI